MAEPTVKPLSPAVKVLGGKKNVDNHGCCLIPRKKCGKRASDYVSSKIFLFALSDQLCCDIENSDYLSSDTEYSYKFDHRPCSLQRLVRDRLPAELEQRNAMASQDYYPCKMSMANEPRWRRPMTPPPLRRPTHTHGKLYPPFTPLSTTRAACLLPTSLPPLTPTADRSVSPWRRRLTFWKTSGYPPCEACCCTAPQGAGKLCSPGDSRPH